MAAAPTNLVSQPETEQSSDHADDLALDQVQREHPAPAGAEGTPHPLENGVLVMTPVVETRVAGRSVPTGWQVALAERGLKINVEAVYPDSWMGTRIPYWEGPVTVTGSHEDIGYLEMSGY